MALSPEQNRVLDCYNALFATEGWKMLIDDLKENQKSILPALMGNKVSIEDVYFLKGRNDVYQYIIGLQSQLEQVKKFQEEAEDE